METYRGNQLTSAALVASGFGGRRFYAYADGLGKKAEKEAIQAACRKFKEDPDVDIARRWLPPTMRNIVNYFRLDKNGFCSL